MNLTYRFTVDAHLDVTWRAINNVESVSECLPGAASLTATGDDLEGQFKIKFGPMPLVYQGTGRIAARDSHRHTVSVEATGRDVRNHGTATATVITRLSEAETGTHVEIAIRPVLTGRPAQLAPEVITEATDWQIDQWAACLSRKLTGSPELIHPVQRTTAATADRPSPRAADQESTGRSAKQQPIPQAIGRARNVTPAFVRQYGIPVLGVLAALFAVLAVVRRKRR